MFQEKLVYKSVGEIVNLPSYRQARQRSALFAAFDQCHEATARLGQPLKADFGRQVPTRDHHTKRPVSA